MNSETQGQITFIVHKYIVIWEHILIESFYVSYRLQCKSSEFRIISVTLKVPRIPRRTRHAFRAVQLEPVHAARGAPHHASLDQIRNRDRVVRVESLYRRHLVDPVLQTPHL
jgi:hypothetical protein